MDAIWLGVSGGLIAVFIAGITYLSLRGKIFFEKKTAELKAKQVLEDATKALQVTVDPLIDQGKANKEAIARLEKSVERRDQYIDSLRDDVLETKFIMQRQATEFSLKQESVEHSLRVSNSQTSELIEGIKDIKKAMLDSVAKYDGQADIILEGMHKTIKKMGGNLNTETKRELEK